MVNKRQSFNVFERIESIKTLLESIIPNKDGYFIRGLLLQCIRYKLGKDATLSSDAKAILDVLLQNHHNPKTVYEWFLLEDVPEHIRTKLEQGKICLNAAREQYVQWKRISDDRRSKDITEEVIAIIRRVSWDNQEHML